MAPTPEKASIQRLTEHYRQQSPHLSKQVRIEQTLRHAAIQLWPAGTRLPPHRQLAEAFGVARHTLARAVASLINDGLLATAHGRGTWTRQPAEPVQLPPINTQLSRRAKRVLAGPGASLVQTGSFMPGVPDIAQFPMRKWRELYASVTVPQNTLLLTYSTGGYGPLKRAIRDFLLRWRQLDCDTDQIIITDGAHNGLQLCAMALTDPGDRVAIESPSYWGARKIFSAFDLELDMLPWWPGQGHSLPEHPLPTQLAYLMGGHHYPLSVPTQLDEKRRLCQALNPAYVIEDDYEFGEETHNNLLYTARSERHILVGSFSKIMFPGLRLGYLVVPKHLAPSINRLRSELFREGRMLDQAVLARFMFDGHLDHWCQRIHREYLGRQQVVHDILGSLPQVKHISPPSHAISLCVEFADGVNDVALVDALMKEQLVMRPLSIACTPADQRSGLIMGVGMLSGETLLHEVKRLKSTLLKLLKNI